MKASQQGFTLVELMVAVVLFTVGLLAMAGTASVMMAMITDSRSRTVAAGVAESRFESIRSTACASRTSGSAVTRGIAETWTRWPLARADDVVVTVQVMNGHLLQTQKFQSFVPC